MTKSDAHIISAGGLAHFCRPGVSIWRRPTLPADHLTYTTTGRSSWRSSPAKACPPLRGASVDFFEGRLVPKPAAYSREALVTAIGERYLSVPILVMQ